MAAVSSRYPLFYFGCWTILMLNFLVAMDMVSCEIEAVMQWTKHSRAVWCFDVFRLRSRSR
jgi:hypothetical protein